MRWILDTSVWARADRDDVRGQIEQFLGGDEGELVLAPSVELEMLRGPQGEAVAARRSELEAAMDVLRVDAETFVLAADAMQELARYEREAHRRPLADLITAALAHQHGCGVIHVDGDFEVLAAHSGLTFPAVRLKLDHRRGQRARRAHPAAKQRELKTQLAQLLHQMPIGEAEAFLDEVVTRARARVEGGTS